MELENLGVYEEIMKALKEKQVKFEEFEHAPVKTTPEAARILGVQESLGIKSLLFKTDKGEFILSLTSGDKKADTKKICEIQECKSLKLASPDEVKSLAGCEVGCVPPFGHPAKIKTFADPELLEKSELYFNPGVNNKTLKVSGADLDKLVNYIKVK